MKVLLSQIMTNAPASATIQKITNRKDIRKQNRTEKKNAIKTWEQ